MLGISKVTDAIKNLLEGTMRAPAQKIPAIIMICSLAKRPGLSCAISTARILDDLGKKGFITDQLPDGSPNLMNQLVHSTVCEVFRALKEDSNIQIAIAPGNMVIQASGGNSGGPVVCVGTNLNAVDGVANLQ